MSIGKQHGSGLEHQAVILEDFWGRRSSEPRFVREFFLFGRRARLSSNDEVVLKALDYSLPLFSVAAPTDQLFWTIQIIVRETPVDLGALPGNLFTGARYTGFDWWLSIQLGVWGHCHIDLKAGTAIAVIEPQIAERPDLLSRYLLNTILTNLIISSGFGMLHCTGLVVEQSVLLLMAPHNSGKSTTALRMVLAGYQLLSDSQIYISPDRDRLELLGFPVGKVKLRQDMLASFPELYPHLESEQVRDETKFTLDLRRFDPTLLYEQAIQPRSIHLCLLKRGESHHTQIRTATFEEAMTVAYENSLFYDTTAVWEQNLMLIERCVSQASCHFLDIGDDAAAVVAAIDALMR